MAFQDRHQTRSGLRKINLVLLEGKGEEGGLWSEGDWFTSATAQPTPRHVPMPVQAQAASFLPVLVPSTRAKESSPCSWGAVLQRECWRCPSSVPCRAGWGAGSHCTADKGKSDRRCQAVSQAHGGVCLSWSSQVARCGSAIWPSWWPTLSAEQRRGALPSCRSSCTAGVFGKSHHHCALRHLTESGGKGKQ